MNSLLFPVLLLGAQAPGDMDAKYTEAVRVFECTFEGTNVDANYDGWPDGWTRRRGRGFPHYLKIGIVDDPAPRPGSGSKSCLSIELDGGAAIVNSPMRPVSPLYSYVLKGQIRTSELVHNEVYFELSFFDKDKKLLESHISEPKTVAPDWDDIMLGPITPKGRNARFARIRCHLRPGAKKADLFGTAMFDDIWLGRLPHMTLETSQTNNIFHRPEDVVAICEISGISEANPLIQYELFDVNHRRIYHEVRPMRYNDPSGRIQWKPLEVAKKPDPSRRRKRKKKDKKEERGYSAVIRYHPPVKDIGFYRFRVSLVGGNGSVSGFLQPAVSDSPEIEIAPPTPPQLLSDDDGNSAPTGTEGDDQVDEMATRGPMVEYAEEEPPQRDLGKGMYLEREITLAVMRKMNAPPHGEFGWAFPHGERALGFKALVNLLQPVGVHWIKFPVWYEADDNQRADELSQFAERLSVYNIELVGVLDVPPPSTRELFGQKEDGLLAAAVFDEDALWQKILDPVLTRMSLKIRWWQLGADSDISFVGFPAQRLIDKMKHVRRYMQRFGQEVHLGLSWNWLYPVPDVPDRRFLSQTIDPPLTSAELQAYLAERPKNVKTWVTLKPLARDKYSVEDRARDLVGRMLAAKVQKADGVFIPDPFDAKHGLMNRDGTPSELLLPWRTTAILTAGADFAGTIQMPNGSSNYVFLRDGKALMVVWNYQETKEVLYLGENVQRVDLWGHSKQLEPKPLPSALYAEPKLRQEVQVGRLPCFLVGIDPQIAAWRMAFRFKKTQLSSVFGRRQSAPYAFQNTFSQGLSGRLYLRTPKVWKVDPPDQRFKIGKGETLQESMSVLLGSDASSGHQPIQIDFDLTARRRTFFSVYRGMQVGLGDVTIELSSKLDGRGKLIVEQVFTNRTTKAVSFNCMLFPPGRRRQRVQVLDQPRGRSTTAFVLDQGEKLIGQTLWVRAEEIGGDRILNYHVKAER